MPNPTPLLATVLQTVNIKSYIPVELDIAESNYTERRCFFDASIGKFGISSHLTSPPTAANRRDREWTMVDQCILSWFYNTISKDVRAIVRAPKATEYTIWNAIHDQFWDHELHRAVYLEAEFRSLFQGDMDIKTYTGRLKQLVDDLHDVGQPIHETSQVLNMLRGLTPKYRHAVPVITAKNPPHTFLSARSYLLLEEQYDKEHAKSTAQHALFATGGSRPTAPAAGEGGSGAGQGGQPPPRPPTVAHGSAPRSDGRRGRGRGHGRGSYQHQGGSTSTPQPRAP
ncbi:unnamed protein product [Miscanthus lutarioriparius]|uniref:Retrotransposon gag domain-containing protein n=1 Tax=Miscanthus lutarioriparius TaxID=422564 RepID=A0A811QU59_9POAL|nr:unnamed protein product [Miscanthus lutarioriparius]